MTFIAPIVEGHGEVQAVKSLLGRIARDAVPGAILQVNEPIRIKSGSFVNDHGYFDRYVAMAAAKARQHRDGHVLILLDCEDDCPAKLGPALLQRARHVASGVGCIVALAHREYETWFVAAVRSLQTVERLDPNAMPPASAEAMRDAKGWLGRHMPHGYDPISHQLAFTNAFDLSQARTVGSFDRLYRKLAGLLS